MIADVIVDVPSMQTDMPYSYRIPANLLDLVQVGVRVHVPFGNGNRLIQGIILAVHDDNQDGIALKDIEEVLDLSPVLNAEQLALADAMRRQVFAYKISILQAMLPSMMHSKYDKLLEMPDGQTIKWSQVQADERHQLMRRAIGVTYLAQNKEKQAFSKHLIVNQAQLADFEPSKNAKQQLALKAYLATVGTNRLMRRDVIRLFSASVVKRFEDLGLVEVEQVAIRRAQMQLDQIQPDQAKSLTAEQAQALERIMQAKKPVLLEGVTGSGKTEVYLQVIQKVLDQGKSAIMLVPEIALTPMMTKRFVARFGQRVAIMHSGLSDGEKYDEWLKIKSGDIQVVVGARSAIFAPLEDIGVIILDEEHDASYKQESNPKYHARDVALLRGDYHQAQVILGSATPSLETRARASKAIYDLVLMTERAKNGAQIPEVTLVDMRKHLNSQSENFSQPLIEAIQGRLERQEQVMLMLNRRGYSAFVMCRDCGHVEECPNCDISLTLHMDTRTLNCHYCGHLRPIPKQCPACHSLKMRYYGTGTQKVQEELATYFPDAKTLRMDFDTTRRKGQHERILRAFEKQEASILIGTQMIAKGLDFPNVTLVGVINADTGLNLPDFRSSERTFQLLTQVAGRAGRDRKPGQVLVQTFNPDHYAMRYAQSQDYEAFYKEEMQFRQQLAYPPYWFTTQLVVSHADEQIAQKAAYEILAQIEKGLSSKAKVLGPVAKPIARTKGLYHYQILIKYRFEPTLKAALDQILAYAQEKSRQQLLVMIDSEPQNFI